MTLLSGNPDGFAFTFSGSTFDKKAQQINHLLRFLCSQNI
jgi:hypothetical protein